MYSIKYLVQCYLMTRLFVRSDSRQPKTKLQKFHYIIYLSSRILLFNQRKKYLKKCSELHLVKQSQDQFQLSFGLWTLMPKKAAPCPFITTHTHI